MVIKVIFEGSSCIDYDDIESFDFHEDFVVLYSGGKYSYFLNRNKIQWFTVEGTESEG